MRPDAPRRTFPFDARAEVSLANSDSVGARVRELSLYGCFLKFPISLPPGTPVLVRIFTESEFFEADGSVIYSQPNVGFALAFRDIKPHFHSANGARREEGAMPRYEYLCPACNKKFSIVLTLAEHEKGQVKCPKCRSRKVEQQWSALYATTSKKSYAARVSSRGHSGQRWDFSCPFGF
jgi:putative FmdB family regulatory protein